MDASIGVGVGGAGSNRQHRFMHKIDEWLNEGSRVIDDIETAENAGRSLPEFAKCTPKEKYAKGI